MGDTLFTPDTLCCLCLTIDHIDDVKVALLLGCLHVCVLVRHRCLDDLRVLAVTFNQQIRC